MRVFFLLSLEITIIGTKTESDGWMEANYSEPTNSKVKSSNYTRRQYGEKNANASGYSQFEGKTLSLRYSVEMIFFHILHQFSFYVMTFQMLIHASVAGLTIDFHFYWPNDFQRNICYPLFSRQHTMISIVMMKANHANHL